ncbi:hypothetical protein [Rhizobium sp. Root483D2]|uniref:hypothetical protein n=1 Tax=Rhizobium sp. Root483D2 TaxID=1736545 RepID=UPI0012E3794F|nr:hypothetical protein [Rhizobium sp. Root483D2]
MKRSNGAFGCHFHPLPAEFGTAVERISDETQTPADSGFVHRYIWAFEAGFAPDAESLF